LLEKILGSNDHSYKKWTQVRLHQDPYLKTEKRKRDPIQIPIVETGGTPDSKPSFKTNAKCKRIIGSAPVFKIENTESETDTESSASPVHSKYIQGVLRRKVSYDHTFGVYQDDAKRSFKIGRSKFKFIKKHLFVDGRRFMATPGPWELLTKSQPDKDTVTNQDRQTYKQILLLANAHRADYNPTGHIRANKVVKYTQFISPLFNDTPKQQIDWETVE
jgi:hypothetical protein